MLLLFRRLSAVHTLNMSPVHHSHSRYTWPTSFDVSFPGPDFISR